ncbi:MAG: glycosyltransferase family 2 protein [Candidatus Nealsonbacteria bacterium]|nr:glycosyltransferase family 2 protein [Candidatus Nealsonbacteria bacterium]
MPKKIISIIIPFFNEEKNIPLVYDKLLKVFNSLQERYNYEIIFIDDGSVDKSPEILENLTNQNKNIKYLQFSRNFGKEIALSAGLDVASGDAVLMIDADLQHPVELIPGFIEKWQNGAEVVVGVRNKNNGEGLVKKLGSLLFYKIINFIGETKITPRATDYRLLDKKVVLAFRRFTEHGRMARGLIDWLGFKREYIYFNANGRVNGTACYDKIKLIKLALNTIVSHSLLPLKLAGYLGIAITSLFGTAGFLLLIGKYIIHNSFAMSFTGTAELAILIIFLVGLVLACLGLVALYIANIKAEVTNRPNYVIRKSSFDRKI